MKKEALRLEWWNPEDLTGNPRNWRRHPPAQAAALRQLLAEVGWAGAALYNERTKRLIDGHLRKRLLRKGEKIPVLVRRARAENLARAGSHRLDGQRGQGRPGPTARLRPVREFGARSVARTLGRHLVAGRPSRPAGTARPTRACRRAVKEVEDCAGQLWQAGPHRLISGDSTKAAVLALLWHGVQRRDTGWSGEEGIRALVPVTQYAWLKSDQRRRVVDKAQLSLI
jgi:hypothetical protein